MAVWRLFFAIAMLVLVGASVAAPVSVGRTYEIPVEVWTKRFGDTTGTVTLLLPETIDEKGTFTVVLRGDPSSRLIKFFRADMPSELDFLFRESDRLYVRVMGPADCTRVAASPMISTNRVSANTRTRWCSSSLRLTPETRSMASLA